MKTLVNRERLLKVFCELAKIKSPSGNEEAIAQNVILRLGQLGLSVTEDDFGNIIAKVDGSGEPLILCGHLDTVAVADGKEIQLVAEEEKIKTDGSTILGADNKDYISAILEMLTVVKENGIPCRPLEVIFTRSEEEISRGAKALKFSLLKGRECLISDSSDPYGTITLSAPYYESFKVTIRGKKAHTKEPEKGINAIAIALEMISSIPLGRISSLVTTNIGFISGGLEDKLSGISLDDILSQGCNSVPDIAKFCGEIRGLDKKEFEKILKHIQQVLNTPRMGKIEVDCKRLAEGYIHAKNDPLIGQIVNVFKEQKIEPNFIDAVGSSDANIFNANGIKAIVISSAHRDNHQISEYLITNDLIRLADFLVRFVTRK